MFDVIVVVVLLLLLLPGSLTLPTPYKLKPSHFQFDESNSPFKTFSFLMHTHTRRCVTHIIRSMHCVEHFYAPTFDARRWHNILLKCTRTHWQHTRLTFSKKNFSILQWNFAFAHVSMRMQLLLLLLPLPLCITWFLLCYAHLKCLQWTQLIIICKNGTVHKVLARARDEWER